MSFVDNYNPQMFVKSELSVFGNRAVQTSIESSYMAEFRPTTVVDTEVLEFFLPASDEYCMMSSVQLYLKMKIIDIETNTGHVNKCKKGEAAAVAGFEKFDGLNILPVNNFMDSLFSHVGEL